MGNNKHDMKGEIKIQIRNETKQRKHVFFNEGEWVKSISGSFKSVEQFVHKKGVYRIKRWE